MKLLIVFYAIFIIVIPITCFLPISILQEFSKYLGSRGLHLPEINYDLWAIIFFLVFLSFIYKFKKAIKNAKSIQNLNEKLNKSLVLLILLTSFYFYASNYWNIHSRNFYQNDLFTRGVLFMGDYFNIFPPEEKASILLDDIEDKQIYQILDDTILEKIYYKLEEENPNYAKFKAFFDSKKCEYVFVRSDRLSSIFKIKFYQNFRIIYESSDYVFAERR